MGPRQRFFTGLLVARKTGFASIVFLKSSKYMINCFRIWGMGPRYKFLTRLLGPREEQVLHTLISWYLFYIASDL